jgi:hypothetical protein
MTAQGCLDDGSFLFVAETRLGTRYQAAVAKHIPK